MHIRLYISGRKLLLKFELLRRWARRQQWACWYFVEQHTYLNVHKPHGHIARLKYKQCYEDQEVKHFQVLERRQAKVLDGRELDFPDKPVLKRGSERLHFPECEISQKDIKNAFQGS